LMSKLDELLKTTGANIDASMGAGRVARPLHGATTPASPALGGRMQGLVRSKDAAEVPVDRIDRDAEQPREEFDLEGLERLAKSLQTRGQLQPIRVRWDEDRGLYVVVCGERRWRAAKLAGIPTLTCIIMERPAGPGELLALQLIENALREDLSAMEQARAYKSLIELNGWSARHLAAELAVNPATVTRALALLELPTPIQDQVELGTLSPGTAYEVSKLNGAEAQVAVATQVIDQHLTRAEVAEVVKAVKARRPSPAARPEPVELDLGDGIIVVVKYRKASGVSPLQALRRATRLLQDRERSDDQAA
jgi:ParB family transcriptional regulator, chromosome partitioning protein